MKLITYNFLTSKSIRGVNVGYPLKLIINKKEVVQQEYNANFIQRLLPKLEWSAVMIAANIVDLSDGLPKELNEDVSENQEILQKLHHLLLEIDVIEGQLQCPESGRIFPITGGIPNMLLNEDEV